MAKITYEDKVDVLVSSLPNKNKINAGDMNQIKNSVNELETDIANGRSEAKIYTDTKIDNLVIGGRNIVLNSNTRIVAGYGSPTISHVSNIIVSEWSATDARRVYGKSGTNKIFGTLVTGRDTFYALKNKAYVFSIYIKNNHTSNLLYISANGLTGDVTLSPGEAKRVVIKCVGNGTSYLSTTFQTATTGIEYDFTYWHYQIEEGTIVSDWSPAPEDADNSKVNKSGDTMTGDLTTSGYLKSNGVVYSGSAIYTHGKTAHTDGVSGIALTQNMVNITATTPEIRFYNGNATAFTTRIYEETKGQLTVNGSLKSTATIYGVGSLYTNGRTTMNDGVPGVLLTTTGAFLTGPTTGIYFYSGNSTTQTTSITDTGGTLDIKGLVKTNSNITTAASVYTNNKIGTTDGIAGTVLTNTGNLHMTSSGTPTIYFYYSNSTSSTSRIQETASSELTLTANTLVLNTSKLLYKTVNVGDYIDDSGWITPTLNTGLTHVSGVNVQYRKVGKRVEIRGRCTGVTVANTDIFTLASGYRPSMVLNPLTSGSGLHITKLEITTGGIVRMAYRYLGGTQVYDSTAFITFDTSFFVD